MLTTRLCDAGADAGKWYAVVIERQAVRRAGYCAIGCSGHPSSDEALAHYLQYQLDRQTDLWLERRSAQDCEVCGDPTTMRARLGRNTKLFVLCQEHQSTHSLQTVLRQRLSRQQSAVPASELAGQLR
jgi:hypothetical protein